MKKIIFIFVIIFIPIFSKYEKYHDEWDDYTVELACFTGNVYKGSSYYRNENLTVCARAFENYFDVALVKNYKIIKNTVEIKFDDDGILTLYDIDTNNNESALYLEEMDSFHVIENMKKRNFMYVKLDEVVYKINLSGFTRDINKMENSKKKLIDTGTFGLRYYLRNLEENRREIFELFDKFWIEHHAYSENDLFYRIEILYNILYSINKLENVGYEVDVKDEGLIYGIVESYVHDDDKEAFWEFYKSDYEK